MARTTRTAHAVRAVALGAAVVLTVTGCSAVEDLFGGDDEPERDQETGEVSEIVEGASIFDIQEGDCIGEISSAEEVQEVDIIPCDQEYQQQVYLIQEIVSDEFPDQETVEAQAEETCVPAFEDFVGMAYEESDLAIYYLSPSQEGWESEEDRDLVCLVYDPSGAVTGSLEGANR
ncbi:hypothetical protein G1H11_00820 [Phytoactinopolyspora alkaliphila]|uniref:Septum formation-related domain-containing protein n=1 Tax=Phytoactinopolyspora alkaliphila TaxID=1783498 RepID=A0A6N9YFS1_9ACTN|nr:hypothetical protein [Phytoactinopolyspora alkaliphila]